MPLAEHSHFVARAIEQLATDPRIVGLGVGGSWIERQMDQFSDLDLVVVIDPAHVASVMSSRREVAATLGTLLSSFTGEHVGEPRLLICLYGDPLLHVDLKFVSLPEVADRVEDPEVLWDRSGDVTKIIGATTALFPPVNVQQLEDRFWVFTQYAASKLGRGELFEVIDFLAFLRDNVLGPMCAAKHGRQARGVRKLEQFAGEDQARFVATLAGTDRGACGTALLAAVEFYRDLRAVLSTPNLVLRTEAERAAVAYLKDVVGRV